MPDLGLTSTRILRRDSDGRPDFISALPYHMTGWKIMPGVKAGENVGDDVFGGEGLSELTGLCGEGGKADGIAQEFADFPDGFFGLKGADGGAGFEQVFAVALFLAGDGIHDHDGAAFGEGFGHGEAAGLADDEIGGIHPVVDIVDESADDDGKAGLCGGGAEFFLQSRVLAGHDEQLGWRGLGGPCAKNTESGADAQTAVQNENGGKVRA